MKNIKHYKKLLTTFKSGIGVNKSSSESEKIILKSLFFCGGSWGTVGTVSFSFPSSSESKASKNPVNFFFMLFSWFSVTLTSLS